MTLVLEEMPLPFLCPLHYNALIGLSGKENWLSYIFDNLSVISDPTIGIFDREIAIQSRTPPL